MRFLFLFSSLAVAISPVAASASEPLTSGKIVAAWSQFVSHDTGTAEAATSESPDAAAATPPAPFPVHPPAIEFRYVVEIESNGTTPDACASYGVAYKDADGNTGVSAAGSARANPDPDRFPITVCALLLEDSWDAAWLVYEGQPATSPAVTIWDESGDTGTRVSLAGPHRIGRRHTDVSGNPELLIATLGDTGCRGDGLQDCATQWPFHDITTNAAAAAPDLFVHVGDYRYYRQGELQNRWNYWLKDFLIPAREALLTAPWALTRGNHEECSDGHSGLGYTYLFGVGDADCSQTVEPSWSFDVAPGGFDSAGKASASHRFVMIDTSKEHTSLLEGAFSDAIDMSDTDSVWWVTHIAPVHLLRYDDETRPSNSNVLEQLSDAVKIKGPLCTTGPDGKSHCKPSQILLGHDHMFQTVTFANPDGSFFWPQSYIVGHGGVDLRGAGLQASSCTYSGFSLSGLDGNQTGTVQTRKEHGYVLWTRSADTVDEPTGWVADPRDKQGSKWPGFANPTPSCI